jgi:hypothetical protein
MTKWISEFIDKLSDFLAHRRGLLPLVGLGLILLNFILVLIHSALGESPFLLFWLVDTNFFLHLGLLIGIFGLMMMWVL